MELNCISKQQSKDEAAVGEAVGRGGVGEVELELELKIEEDDKFEAVAVAIVVVEVFEALFDEAALEGEAAKVRLERR